MTSGKEELALKHKDAGNKLFKDKNYHEAINEYSKAIEFDPTVSIFYSNRAFCNLKIENFTNSLEDCDKAVQLDNNNIKAYYRKGLSFIGLMQYKKAKTQFKIVLKVKPQDEGSKKALEMCEKIIFQNNFENALSGGDTLATANGVKDPKDRICNTVSLDSFDGNADLQSYNGVKLDFVHKSEKDTDLPHYEVTNMDQNFISFMVNDLFLKSKYLPKKYVAAILSHVDYLFRNEPTMVKLYNNNMDEDKTADDVMKRKITIVGDTHGQFYDVLNMLKKFGKVSDLDNHVYLFNGDFVDRGSWSCEVALLLYCLKIVYPTKIFINRGNHETDSMNQVYGFEDECKFKYSNRLFKMFSETFDSLPLCTLINDSYLVMHGGLTSDPETSLEEINKINRFKQPPREGPFMELLWSDPQEEPGFGPSQRGLGYRFGPDITEKFLNHNKLRKIFRSHEVRHNGVHFEQNGKLVTVFSAPNYCDVQGNQGGVVHAVPGKGTVGQHDNDDDDLIVELFQAVEHPNMKPMAYCKTGGLGF